MEIIELDDTDLLDADIVLLRQIMYSIADRFREKNRDTKEWAARDAEKTRQLQNMRQ